MHRCVAYLHVTSEERFLFCHGRIHSTNANQGCPASPICLFSTHCCSPRVTLTGILGVRLYFEGVGIHTLSQCLARHPRIEEIGLDGLQTDLKSTSSRFALPGLRRVIDW